MELKDYILVIINFELIINFYYYYKKGWFPTVLHRGQNWAYFGGYEIAKRILTPPGKEGKLSPLSSIIAGKNFF